MKRGLHHRQKTILTGRAEATAAVNTARSEHSTALHAIFSRTQLSGTKRPESFMSKVQTQELTHEVHTYLCILYVCIMCASGRLCRLEQSLPTNLSTNTFYEAKCQNCSQQEEFP